MLLHNFSPCQDARQLVQHVGGAGLGQQISSLVAHERLIILEGLLDRFLQASVFEGCQGLQAFGAHRRGLALVEGHLEEGGPSSLMPNRAATRAASSRTTGGPLTIPGKEARNALAAMLAGRRAEVLGQAGDTIAPSGLVPLGEHLEPLTRMRSELPGRPAKAATALAFSCRRGGNGR